MLYLKQSILCDYKNKTIFDKIEKISNETDDDKTSAMKIFNFVRDKIPFNATLNIFQKASKSIKQKVIDYCNKVNIHMALLKAKNIPCRLHYVKTKKERLKGIIPDIMYGKIPDPIGHFYIECFVNNKWIACEAIYDKKIYNGMLHHGIINKEQIPSIDWDGENDLILFSKQIVEDVDVYENLDDIIETEIKKYSYPPKWICKLVDWTAKLGSKRRTNRIRKIE